MFPPNRVTLKTIVLFNNALNTILLTIHSMSTMVTRNILMGSKWQHSIPGISTWCHWRVYIPICWVSPWLCQLQLVLWSTTMHLATQLGVQKMQFLRGSSHHWSVLVESRPANQSSLGGSNRRQNSHVHRGIQLPNLISQNVQCNNIFLSFLDTSCHLQNVDVLNIC